MKITLAGDYLIINLAHERKYLPNHVPAFEAAMVQAIPEPLCELNPLNNEWTVPATFRGAIERLREEHLVDKNQQSLF